MFVYWGAKAKVDLYQNALPEQWAAAHAQIKYIPVLSDESAGQSEKDKLTEVEEIPVQDIYSGDVHNKILAEDANDEVQEDAGAPNVLPIDNISGANGLALDKELNSSFLG